MKQISFNKIMKDIAQQKRINHNNKIFQENITIILEKDKRKKLNTIDR